MILIQSVTIRKLNLIRCLLVLGSIFLSACENHTTTKHTNIAPDNYIYQTPNSDISDLATSSLTEQGINQQAIIDSVKEILSNRFGSVDSMLIYRNGHLVLEEYFNGYTANTRHDIRSATKSITSILLGIAIDQRYLLNEAEIMYEYFTHYNHFDSWNSQKEEITLKHLLTMSGGLDCNDHYLYSQGRESSMYRHSDWVKFILDLPIKHRPGKVWSYCTGGVVVLGEVIHKASNQSVTEFSQNNLFSKLGITNYHWSETPAGQIDTGGHIFITPRAMLKIGIMMLQNGQWQNEQIVSEKWVEKSFNRTFNWYGYLWWISQFEKEDDEFEPFDIYSASGNGGNKIFIIPQLEMVVVFTGSNYNSPLGGSGDQILFESIIPASL